MDVENYKSGSVAFMKDLHQRAHCQISIFSDAESYRRVEMVPPKFNPLLCQVNLLLTQYLLQTEKGKVVRYYNY